MLSILLSVCVCVGEKGWIAFLSHPMASPKGLLPMAFEAAEKLCEGGRKAIREAIGNSPSGEATGWEKKKISTF